MLCPHAVLGVSDHWTGFRLECGTGMRDWNVGLECGTGMCSGMWDWNVRLECRLDITD